MATVTDTQLESWMNLRSMLSYRQKSVYEVIASRGGATSREVASALNLPLHSVSGRITELCSMGMVRDSMKRAYDSSSQRRLVVWEIPPVYPSLLTKER